MKEYSYERLEALREITKLNPVAYAKVVKARHDADKFRDLYMKYEPNDQIGVDYTIANELEYELRFRALENGVEKQWKQYLGVEDDGYGLEDWAEDVLSEHMKNNEQNRGSSR